MVLVCAGAITMFFFVGAEVYAKLPRDRAALVDLAAVG